MRENKLYSENKRCVFKEPTAGGGVSGEVRGGGGWGRSEGGGEGVDGFQALRGMCGINKELLYWINAANVTHQLGTQTRQYSTPVRDCAWFPQLRNNWAEVTCNCCTRSSPRLPQTHCKIWIWWLHGWQHSQWTDQTPPEAPRQK